MLTRKQHELLLLIHERLQAEGVPPSFDEMKDALDLKSKSGIHRLITALEERGFIHRLPNRARALEVIKLPDGYEKSTPAVFQPSVIDGGLFSGKGPVSGGTTRASDNVTPFPGQGAIAASKAAERSAPAPLRGGLAARYGANTTSSSKGFDESGSAGFEIPVMGRIAAGVPIAAIQDITRLLNVPAGMIGVGKHFALDVQGDSMINAGILDGDTVIIQETNSAELGDIVVALVDDEEATLKRFRKQDGKIALEAANPAYETRILSADRVKVQGRLKGLIRNYH